MTHEARGLCLARVPVRIDSFSLAVTRIANETNNKTCQQFNLEHILNDKQIILNVSQRYLS